MTVVHKVEIDRVSIFYNVIVSTSKGDMQFRVRDDGWALFVQYGDTNRPYARIAIEEPPSSGSVFDRVPDKVSALVALTAWAKERFED